MSYFLLIEHNRVGPFEMAQVLEGYTRGEYPRSSLVWTEGMADWQELSKVIDLSSVPPPPPATSPQGGFRSQYPKWAAICASICLVLWLSTLAWQSSIEDEARPYINESARMQSGEYVATTFLESLYRGANGDPLGTFHDEYGKSSQIQDRLSQLRDEYNNAKSAGGFFLLLTSIFTGISIWKHLQHMRWTNAALAVLFVLSLGACSRSPAGEIESVLNRCAKLSDEVNRSSLSAAQSARYLAFKMQEMDTRGCPQDFRVAFQQHINAWQFASPYLAENTRLNAFFEGFASGFFEDSSFAGTSTQNGADAIRNINTTYERLAAIAVAHGARVPFSEVRR